MARMTSGASATNSAAYLRRCRHRSAQRLSIRTLRPSVQPNCCRPCWNAATRPALPGSSARHDEHADAPHPLGLLRTRRERPRRRRAAEKRDELAPARASPRLWQGNVAVRTSILKYRCFASQRAPVQRPARCPLWVKSGHVRCNGACPLCANSGHSAVHSITSSARASSVGGT